MGIIHEIELINETQSNEMAKRYMFQLYPLLGLIIVDAD